MCESVFDSCVCVLSWMESYTAVQRVQCVVFITITKTADIYTPSVETPQAETVLIISDTVTYTVYTSFYHHSSIYPSIHALLPALWPLPHPFTHPPISPLELGSFLRLDSWHQSLPPPPLLWLLIQQDTHTHTETRRMFNKMPNI